MKLFFDENLSPRLAQLLEDLFPGSIHVRDVGLKAAEDPLVWEYARDNDLTLVSKDSDMHQRSFVLGPPPKIVWVRLGNCSPKLKICCANISTQSKHFTTTTTHRS